MRTCEPLISSDVALRDTGSAPIQGSHFDIRCGITGAGSLPQQIHSRGAVLPDASALNILFCLHDQLILVAERLRLSWLFVDGRWSGTSRLGAFRDWSIRFRLGRLVPIIAIVWL